ncbi:MAG: DUF1846 family protein [Coriobacteriales bacterium]|nr:DUF1846 family protein [Coriobacteriales bacterium]
MGLDDRQSGQRARAILVGELDGAKTEYLGSSNPRLHTDEILIALSSSAAHNELAERAMQQLPKLKGSTAHTTVLVSSIDESMFKKLGINLTCEPRYEQTRIYHKH